MKSCFCRSETERQNAVSLYKVAQFFSSPVLFKAKNREDQEKLKLTVHKQISPPRDRVSLPAIPH